MIKFKQVLELGILFAIVSFSSAQAENCTKYQNNLKAFQNAYAAESQAQDSFDAVASGSRDVERHALCLATKNTIFTLRALKLHLSAGCIGDPSRYQESVDNLAQALHTLGSLEGLTCVAGE